MVEYTLILAFLVLGCIGIIGLFMPSVKAIWSGTTTTLSTAGSVASGS